MSLVDLVRNAIATANRATSDLQVEVTLRRATRLASDGEATLASPVTLRAIVEPRQQRIVSRDGIERISRARVTFLESLPIDLIDLTDELMLPDGSTGPILAIQVPHPSDPAGGAFFVVVWL